MSICLLIMLDTLLLRLSLHCNTSLHFATLHPTTLHYTYRHFFLSFTLQYPFIWLNTFTFLSFYFTPLNYTQYTSHLQNYFQNKEPLHCPKELLTISLHALSIFFFLGLCRRVIMLLQLTLNMWAWIHGPEFFDSDRDKWRDVVTALTKEPFIWLRVIFWTANKETQKDSLPWCCLEHVRINVNLGWKTTLNLNVEGSPCVTNPSLNLIVRVKE